MDWLLESFSATSLKQLFDNFSVYKLIISSLILFGVAGALYVVRLVACVACFALCLCSESGMLSGFVRLYSIFSGWRGSASFSLLNLLKPGGLAIAC